MVKIETLFDLKGKSIIEHHARAGNWVRYGSCPTQSGSVRDGFGPNFIVLVGLGGTFLA